MENETLIEKINEDLKLLRKLTNEKPMFQIYEFYNGDQLIMVGTLDQISRYTTYKKSTLISYSYPGYLNNSKRGEHSPKMYKVGERHT